MNFDYNYEEIRTVNTHCHHLRDDSFETVSLYKLLQCSYVSWIESPKLDNYEGRQAYFDRLSANSYFSFQIKAFEEIYGDGLRLTANTWDEFDLRIKKAYENKGHHLDLLKNKCSYSAIILDDFTSPGSDHNLPDLFFPTFRCDMFLCSYKKGKTDNNNNDAYDYFTGDVNSFSQYVRACKESISGAVAKGAVALKIAIAYERSLNFEYVSLEKAQKAFNALHPTNAQKKAFSDRMMFEIAGYAAEINVPIQFHTGLGGLFETGAIYLKELIEKNPKTKFCLFHGSYPFTNDIFALAHNYKNVFIDLCWLPTISNSRAATFLREALELVDSHRVMWGCDTWTSEDSYAALLAARSCFTTATKGLLNDGIINEKYIKYLQNRFFFQNAVDCYHLGEKINAR